MDAAARLGVAEGERAVLITADGLGSCHSANVAIQAALRAGEATSAGVMIPCPWARHAAATHRGNPVGVSLTLNSEHTSYRWGPLTQAPSLLDGNGGFPQAPDDLWEHADLAEVTRELRAQLERAILWGFSVTHLSSHLDALPRRPEFFDVALELAVEFHLPLRLGSARSAEQAGFPFRDLAGAEGVLSPDHVVHLGRGPHDAEQIIARLDAGITELVVSPAVASEELRALDSHWTKRVEHDSVLREQPSLRQAAEVAHVRVLSWSDLREAQRAA